LKVLWLAQTLGVKFDIQIVTMAKGEHKHPDYVAKNAHGAVPTLELPDGQILFESGAIILYLLENYDKGHKLTGAPGSKERNTFLNYLALGAETENAVIPYFLHTQLYPPQMRSEAVASESKKKWDDKLNVFYHRLLDGNKTNFANGTQNFSALDVVVGYPLNVANRGGLLENHPDLKAYVERVTQHPFFASSHVQPK
jgi:glutathione S-transferase